MNDERIKEDLQIINNNLNSAITTIREKKAVKDKAIKEEIDEILYEIGTPKEYNQEVLNTARCGEIFLYNFKQKCLEKNIDTNKSELYFLVEGYVREKVKESKNLLTKYLETNEDTFQGFFTGIYILFNKRIETKEIDYNNNLQSVNNINKTLINIDLEKDLKEIFEIGKYEVKKLICGDNESELDRIIENCNYDLNKLGIKSRLGNEKVPERKNSNGINSNIDTIINIRNEIENKYKDYPYIQKSILEYVDKTIKLAVNYYLQGCFYVYDCTINSMKKLINEKEKVVRLSGFMAYKLDKDNKTDENINGLINDLEKFDDEELKQKVEKDMKNGVYEGLLSPFKEATNDKQYILTKKINN